MYNIKRQTPIYAFDKAQVFLIYNNKVTTSLFKTSTIISEQHFQGNVLFVGLTLSSKMQGLKNVVLFREAAIESSSKNLVLCYRLFYTL